MDAITRAFKEHYSATFEQHGATPKGVDWGAAEEVDVRYDKMLAVLEKDFAEIPANASLLDVGCGWGGLLHHLRGKGLKLDYSGIDVVGPMVDTARGRFPDAEFITGNVLELERPGAFDFVVCNGILTLKLQSSIVAMEQYAKQIILKMYDLCRHGIAFNMMSTRVNFMKDTLYYQNPGELLTWMLNEVSPRVRVDHGYSSLGSGRGKLYEFTVYAYKD